MSTNIKTKTLPLKLEIKNDLPPSSDWIYFDTDPLLKQVCEEVTTLNEKEMTIINQMVSYIDTCYAEKDKPFKIKAGIAVAAPQMGLLKRIIYIHFKEHDVEYRLLLANPKIVSKSVIMSYLTPGEGCLSVKNEVKGYVPRNYKVVIEATDMFTGLPIKFSAVDVLSICLQHEIDHLDGKLYHERINKKSPMHVDPNWLVVS